MKLLEFILKKRRDDDENEYFEAGTTVHEHIVISLLSGVGR